MQRLPSIVYSDIELLKFKEYLNENNFESEKVDYQEIAFYPDMDQKERMLCKNVVY